MRYRLVIENWSLWVIIVFGVLGVGLSRLGMLKAIEATGITFLLLCVFSINQVIFNNKLLDRMQAIAKGRRVAESINVEEFYSRLEYEVLQATETVDLTIHTSANPEIVGGRFWEEYFSAIDSVIRKGRVMVRRIVTINTKDKLKSVEGWIKKYQDCTNLCIRYSQIRDYGIPAPMSVQVIDGRVAFLAGLSTGGHIPYHRNIDVYLQDDDLAKALQDYYNRYWDSLPILKEGRTVNEDLLDEIRQRFESSTSS